MGANRYFLFALRVVFRLVFRAAAFFFFAAIASIPPVGMQWEMLVTLSRCVNERGVHARFADDPRMHDRTLTFPSDFVFGVATAAYQVEGHIENDWSAWERSQKLRHSAGAAVDHWNRYQEDYRLAREVGAGAFRVSLEWARIEPRRGHIDLAALDAYRTRLVAMRAAGLRPVVTLHHFTHPGWFHRETPWHEPESVNAFRRYARACAEILRGLDALVVSFNEPVVLMLGGYVKGLIPPGLVDTRIALPALGNIARAHVAAREELRLALGPVPVGISQNVLAFTADRSWHPLDQALVRLADAAYNHAFLEALTTGTLTVRMPGLFSSRQEIGGGRDSLDYLGLNYYTRARLRFVPRNPFLEFHYRDPFRRGLTDIGWEQYPEGFEQLLLTARRYGLPIWVTENGIDDRRGDRRSAYLHTHWRALLAARAAGADIRGYLYWSLVDNFEWLEGWGPRFGLYRVDFQTLERSRTPACDYFREIAFGRVLRPPAPAAEADVEQEGKGTVLAEGPGVRTGTGVSPPL
jgi:beta-glucosidase